MSKVIEDEFEREVILPIFNELGYEVLYGPDIGPDGTRPERDSYEQVILSNRLHGALRRINPSLSAEVIEDALRQLHRVESPDLLTNNHLFHQRLRKGIKVEARTDEGALTTLDVLLVDENKPDNNEWLVVNQFTVTESRRTRRPDVVVFLNGLPVAVIELKSPSEEGATLQAAFNQLQTYKQELPTFFITNSLLVACDGYKARSGTLSSDWDRFMMWRTIDGNDISPKEFLDCEILIRGLFDPKNLLEYLLHFIVFEEKEGSTIKKAAGYHQFWAVKKAVLHTVSACGASRSELIDNKHFDRRRIGVIWHTQGSGKSLSMAFYAGRVVSHPAMQNPTVIVITDRNDLDEQLYGTFTGCRELLRQTPSRAESRADLRQLLSVASGGVVFTTVQKFFPEQKGDTYPLLTDRSNVIVIADEAHRSQYDFIDGFARHMRDALPNASFIGFTGTPIERDDRNTPAVFGDYIDVYDIYQAVEDRATVPIYYESRLAQIELREEIRSRLDPEFDEITEGHEETAKDKLRSKWAALEAMVGTEERLETVAKDLVKHYETREESLDGKAMIVCMSRRICVDLYQAIIKLRPDWHNDDDAEGMIKIVMSGSASDHLDWQKHIRNKKGREGLAKRFKRPNDPLKIVIVRDMWLTGFDCPCLHTLYIDKPMSGHNLMQAIARVNRVFRDKPGGLVVDYIGLADSLQRAIVDYTQSGGRGDATLDLDEAAIVLQEKYSVVKDMMHTFDYNSIHPLRGRDRLLAIQSAMDFIFSLDNGKKRYLDSVSQLSKAFALTVPHPEALAIKDDVGLFQEIRTRIVKDTGDTTGKSPDEMDAAIRQLVSKAVASTDVVDIFSAAGIGRPDISILSDGFLEDVRKMPKKNLAVEMLHKLIKDEIKTRSKKNIVQAQSFSESVEKSIRKYRNRTVEAAMVIEELIGLAKELRNAQQRGEELGLSDDEVAFYDALCTNGSAESIMGDDQLRALAQELVRMVRSSVTVDWTLRESARAAIRRDVKRLLRKYGYPPDKELLATDRIIQQAETLCEDWTK